MLVAQLPYRRSSYLYHHAHDDLTDQPRGFLVALKFQPCWVKGTWKFVATGRHWGDETRVEYRQDQIHLLRLTGEQVSVSEIAWILYRAHRIVQLFREEMRDDEILEKAAEIALGRELRMVERVMAANGLDQPFHRELLNTELFLLTIAPIRKREEE